MMMARLMVIRRRDVGVDVDVDVDVDFFVVDVDAMLGSLSPSLPPPLWLCRRSPGLSSPVTTTERALPKSNPT